MIIEIAIFLLYAAWTALHVARIRPRIGVIRISRCIFPSSNAIASYCHDVGYCSTIGANGEPACQRSANSFVARSESPSWGRTPAEGLPDPGPVLGRAPRLDAGRDRTLNRPSALDPEPSGAIFMRPQLSVRAAWPIYARLRCDRSRPPGASSLQPCRFMLRSA